MYFNKIEIQDLLPYVQVNMTFSGILKYQFSIWMGLPVVIPTKPPSKIQLSHQLNPWSKVLDGGTNRAINWKTCPLSWSKYLDPKYKSWWIGWCGEEYLPDHPIQETSIKGCTCSILSSVPKCQALETHQINLWIRKWKLSIIMVELNIQTRKRKYFLFCSKS